MTKNPNDGGPAYPQGPFMYGEDGHPLFDRKDQVSPGMSLRDAFAMAALQGMLAGTCANVGKIMTGFKEEALEEDRIAKVAYCYADAMLAERAEFYEQPKPTSNPTTEH